MRHYIDKFQEYLISRNLSRGYKQALMRGLRRFEQYLKKGKHPLDPARWDTSHLCGFHAALTEYRYPKADGVLHPLSNSDKNQHLNAVKCFCTWISSHQSGIENPFEHFELMHKRSFSGGFDITEDDIRRLIMVCEDTGKNSVRDHCIISLFYGTGLRLMELSLLDVRDLDLGETLLIVKIGKNGVGRQVPLGLRLIQVLREYLSKTRKNYINPDKRTDALFLNKYGKRLSMSRIEKIVSEKARKAGIPGLTPHKLRHAYALHMLRRGCDIRYIQEILGHVKLSTTTIYTKIFDNDLMEKIDQFHPSNQWGESLAKKEGSIV